MHGKHVWLLTTAVILATPGTFAGEGEPAPAAPAALHSPYAGEESRPIKSLSASDVEELKRGGGWGLAKAAELNGMPGPKHVLDMKTELALTDEQTRKIEKIFEEMRSKAIPLGEALIGYEKQLNDGFADRSIDDAKLAKLLDQIASTHRDLRLVHLAAHLRTPEVLTREQIDTYNRLRGYQSSDPCRNIPAGHDPVMWKKHNGCD